MKASAKEVGQALKKNPETEKVNDKQKKGFLKGVLRKKEKSETE